MTVGSAIRLIRERWKLICAVTVATVLLGVAATAAMPYKYAATVTLYVYSQTSSENAAAAYQGSLLSEQRVRSYSELLASNRIGESVVRDLNLSLTAEEVTNEISVNAEPQSVLMQATVTDESPQRATDIANATARSFTDLVADIEQPPNREAPPAVAVKIVEGAVLSDGPVSPRWPTNLLVSSIIGLLLGLSAAYIRSVTNNTIRSNNQATLAANAPSLGVIGQADEWRGRGRLVPAGSSYSPQAEEFKRLRTNLNFLSIDRQRRCLVVTSSLPGEGKTSVACNLGLVSSEAGYRTLVLDADMRRPAVAETFQVERTVGLTSILTGRASLPQAVQAGPNASLNILASGPVPPNPSELLASENMRELLERLSASYDLVLIDTPPLIPVTDAAVVSRYSDGAIVVARHAEVKPDQLAAAVESLRTADVDVLGIVFNGATDSEPLATSRYHAYQQGERHSSPRTINIDEAPTDSVRRPRPKPRPPSRT